MYLLNNVEKARQTERLQLRFNIPNIPEKKRDAERMMKQSLGFFKALPRSIQRRFNLVSTRLKTVEGGWQTLSALPFNKIERMLKQMSKPFARALTLFASQLSL